MTCKNCKNSLNTQDRFCSNCGAKIIAQRLTLKYLFSEISKGFLNIDSSKPILTFIDMFKTPDVVIVGYLNGTRKKYINAFGYFTIALTMAGFFTFVMLRFFPQALEDTISLQQTEIQRQVNETILRYLFDYQALLFFSTIPFLAVLSRLLFLKNKSFNYTEHLVINLYTYAHGSILFYTISILTIWVPYSQVTLSIASIPLFIVFYFYVLKRIYNLKTKTMLLKTVLFCIILAFVMFTIMVITSIILYQNGVLNELIEEVKSNKETISYIASSINWTS